MTEKGPRPEDPDFTAWESGFKHVEQGHPLPLSHTMSDFFQNRREIFDHMQESGRSIFLKDDNNPRRVHFWIYPVDGGKIMAMVMPHIIKEAKERSEKEDDEPISTEEALEELLNRPDEPHQDIDIPEPQNYLLGDFHDQPENILSEVADRGEPKFIVKHLNFLFRINPIPLLYQEGFEEEFLQEEAQIIQDMKNERKDFGLET